MAAHFVRTLRSTTNHFRFRSQTLQGASCLLCGNGPRTSRLHTYGVISRRQGLPRLCSTVTTRPFSSQVPTATQGVEETEEADELYKEVVVEVKGHDAAVLNSYEKFVTLAAGELDVTVGRVFTPPKVITRWTQLKSVHIFKKHRVQYEARTHYKVFELQRLTGSTADTFLEYIQRHLPEGMAMKVTKHRLETIPEHLKPPTQSSPSSAAGKS